MPQSSEMCLTMTHAGRVPQQPLPPGRALGCWPGQRTEAPCLHPAHGRGPWGICRGSSPTHIRNTLMRSPQKICRHPSRCLRWWKSHPSSQRGSLSGSCQPGTGGRAAGLQSVRQKTPLSLRQGQAGPQVSWAGRRPFLQGRHSYGGFRAGSPAQDLTCPTKMFPATLRVSVGVVPIET